MREKTRLDQGAQISKQKLLVRKKISDAIIENSKILSPDKELCSGVLSRILNRSWQYADGLLTSNTTLNINDLVDLANIVSDKPGRHESFIQSAKKRLHSIYGQNLHLMLLKSGCGKEDSPGEINRQKSCEKLGRSPGYLTKLLKGSISPTVDTVVGIAERLDWYDKKGDFSFSTIYKSKLQSDEEFIKHISIF